MQYFFDNIVKISVLIFYSFDNILRFKLFRFWVYFGDIFLATNWYHKLKAYKLKRENSSQEIWPNKPN